MNTTLRIGVTRAQTLLTVKLAVMDCPSCGVIFGIPDEMNERRRDDGKTFYCPSGHDMSYHPTKADKLAEELRQAERDRDWYKEAEADQRRWRGQAERRLAATKGQVTKLKKRIVAGSCPFGCRRHFANLERHVATKHPGAQLEAEHDGKA